MKLSRRRKAKLQRAKNEAKSAVRKADKAFNLAMDRIEQRQKKIRVNRSAL
jgi:hypothetical protein